MRLIDADKLLRFFTVDTANQTYRFGTIKKQIENAETVQAIPLDKIKQAKEEMKECSYSLRCFNEDVFDEDERVVDLDNVLIILDKLIAESEGVNEKV